jgi:hypothetical protein
VFVPDKPFQPALMLATNAGAYPSEVTERNSPLR